MASRTRSLRLVEGSETAQAVLVHVDPRTLLVHPGNLRTDLGDLAELEASIAANGVVQALTLLPDGDGYRILAGHRRAAAAVAVLDSGRWPAERPETMPGIVRADLAEAAAQQVAVMLVENDADQRTPLTVTERAAGYAQLVAFDLDAAEIGRRVGKSAAHVESALRLGRMNATVQAHADAGRLSLEDVAELVEFDDDPKVQARILEDAGSPWGIRHRMADERRRRADRKAEQDLRVELAEAGVAVVAKPKGWPFEARIDSADRRLRSLIVHSGLPVFASSCHVTRGRP
jgi:ParB/RepB/Spo0J family partition protein